MDKIIQLEKMYSANIITRRTISELYAKINKLKEKKIIFDFKNIEFMSRSCTDEYIKQKNKSPKKITEINQTKDIQKMFSIVQKTQNHTSEQHIENMPETIMV